MAFFREWEMTAHAAERSGPHHNGRNCSPTAPSFQKSLHAAYNESLHEAYNGSRIRHGHLFQFDAERPPARFSTGATVASGLDASSVACRYVPAALPLWVRGRR